MQYLKYFICFFTILTLTGCSSKKLDGLVPVSGIVFYKGEPLADAAVAFTPKDYKSGDRIGTGTTDDRGRFSLRTIGEIGVLPNEYGVMIIKNVEDGQMKKKGQSGNPKQNTAKKIKSVIPVRYNKSETSGLVFMVGKNGLSGIKIELAD